MFNSCVENRTKSGQIEIADHVFKDLNGRAVMIKHIKQNNADNEIIFGDNLNFLYEFLMKTEGICNIEIC